MDDVLSVKSNVTICLIELRESKEQSQELLRDLKSWFAERKKKVCKEMAWKRALGVDLLFFLSNCSYVHALFCQLFFPIKDGIDIQLLEQPSKGSGPNALLADGIASVRQIEDTLLECKSNLTKLFTKAFQAWNVHAGSTTRSGRSVV
jgi:hypothetical protein